MLTSTRIRRKNQRTSCTPFLKTPWSRGIHTYSRANSRPEVQRQDKRHSCQANCLKLPLYWPIRPHGPSQTCVYRTFLTLSRKCGSYVAILLPHVLCPSWTVVVIIIHRFIYNSPFPFRVYVCACDFTSATSLFSLAP